MRMKRKPIYKEETQAHAEKAARPTGALKNPQATVAVEDVGLPPEQTPACCLTCRWNNRYIQAIGRVKECAAFGTTAGVKWDKCGAWGPKS